MGGDIATVICCSVFMLALGISSLVMQTKIPEGATCEDSSLSRNVSLKEWLVVSGAIDIAFVVCLLIGAPAIIKGNDILKKIGIVFVVIAVLLAIGNFCWNIVGSVLFWRDCLDRFPENINDYMYARLIISYIFGCSV